ncbi:hypothetical protein ACFQ8T_06660 [Isoptericola sp. NPDC056618]|uniref:hypothetical protein n=1 Tax=Isoptericola sp. NPDC056618 TaxID=3345878 RepID=UPI0036B58207
MTIQRVQTRMRDVRLLAAALADTQAVVTWSAEALVADWQAIHAEFRRDDQGIWQVDMTGDVDQDSATTIVKAVDLAYGRQVQRAVLTRLHERAPAAGLTVVSERVEDDDSVTLVLDVHQGGS